MMSRVYAGRNNKPETTPSQDIERLAWTAQLPLEDFIAWLHEINQTSGMSSTQLWNLYGEFCLATESQHLSKGQFNRRKSAAGIERYREPVGKRRWLYAVRSDNHTDRNQRREAQQLALAAGVVDLTKLRERHEGF